MWDMDINEIYEMIVNPLTDETLKELINIIETNPGKSLYETLKNTKNMGPLEYETTIKNFFQKYINKLIRYEREDIKKNGNKALLEDYDLLKENYELLENMTLNEIFSSEMFAKLNYKTVFPQKDGSRYIHIKDLGYSENIDCRIYMCPNSENCMQICNLIVDRHNKYKIPCYFKINTNTNDNDRIVMYSSYENFQIHCKIIKEIQSEYPQLFEHSEKNLLWSNIKDYQNIYFGEEPYRTGFESYSSRLCGTIESAYRDFRYLYKDETNDANLYNEFKKYLYYEFLKVNINPINPAFNYSAKKVNSVNDGITQINYNSEVYQIYVCPFISKDECRITIDSLGFYSINIPKQDFYLLYERQPDDINYEQSEIYRHEIIEKLLELKNNYEKESKTELYQSDYSGNKLR